MTEFSPDCLARMRRVTTATLTTQLFKRGLRNRFLQGVRPLGRYGANMVGPAFTLRNIPAREDIDVVEGFANPEHPQRKAIETTPAGHVLVVDCRGDARPVRIAGTCSSDRRCRRRPSCREAATAQRR